MQEELEKRLEELIALVKGMNKTRELPLVLSRERACEELNWSKKTLQRRINEGVILICEGGIPRSEIERLATPRPRFEPQKPAPRGGPGSRGPKPKDGRSEGQKMREFLAEQRKKKH